MKLKSVNLTKAQEKIFSIFLINVIVFCKYKKIELRSKKRFMISWLDIRGASISSQCKAAKNWGLSPTAVHSENSQCFKSLSRNVTWISIKHGEGHISVLCNVQSGPEWVSAGPKDMSCSQTSPYFSSQSQCTDWPCLSLSVCLLFKMHGTKWRIKQQWPKTVEQWNFSIQKELPNIPLATLQKLVVQRCN